jgi:hypothetical protein
VWETPYDDLEALEGAAQRQSGKPFTRPPHKDEAEEVAATLDRMAAWGLMAKRGP